MKTLVSFALVVSTFLPSVVMAAGGAHHEGSARDLIFPWVNFLLYVGVLFLVLRRPLAAMWEARRASILASVNEGKRANDEARVVYTAAQERARALPETIRNLSTRIASEATGEEQAIRIEADARVQKIAQTAQETLLGEQKAFQIELRRQFVEEVLRRSEEKLRSQIDESTDRGLREGSLKHIKALLH